VRLVNNQIFDVVIIGGGPAGLSAGIYTSRAKLSSLLIEKMGVGGQIANAEQVDNYPGFPDGISGFVLGQLIHKQATEYGVKTVFAEVTGIEVQEEHKLIKTSEGDFLTRAVIIAGGSDRQKLGVQGETEFTGRGVSYCATCDAPFFKDKAVAVVGGGDAAITEAMHLTRFASRITVIHRRNQLRASRILQDKAFAEAGIEFMWGTIVDRIYGGDFVNNLVLHNVITGEKSSLEVDGIFISIGFKPNTEYLRGILLLDAGGNVITNEKMETKIPGIFAAGDIRHNSARQAITAAGDGVTAAIYADRFLTE
jgi:thioredoxin reductase (NADPH)